MCMDINCLYRSHLIGSPSLTDVWNDAVNERWNLVINLVIIMCDFPTGKIPSIIIYCQKAKRKKVQFLRTLTIQAWEEFCRAACIFYVLSVCRRIEMSNESQTTPIKNSSLKRKTDTSKSDNFLSWLFLLTTK